ncbi:MAG: hypothetical protein VR78_01985 [Hoeflea sp. BRH_c9]|nr:MAG: hypothetical protein VR78_01985 [Hoeflea sp. BRH_c9]
MLGTGPSTTTDRVRTPVAAGRGACGIPPFSLREEVPAKPADEGSLHPLKPALIRLAAAREPPSPGGEGRGRAARTRKP